MSRGDSYGWGWLAGAVALAIAARLAPMAFETPIGRDVVEYSNVAENLRGGEGFRLDIKAYYASKTDVAHYSGHDRAPLTPLMLAPMQGVVGSDRAARVFGPLLFIVMVAGLYDLARKRLSPEGAFWLAALVALHPGLRAISLAPLSEVVTLSFIVAALWSFDRLESPAATGVACALAFLARPSAALAGVVFGVIYLGRASKTKKVRDLALFVPLALLGPAALIALNAFNDAPLFLTPQSFLFRVINFADGVHYFERSPIYDSAWALLAENGALVARLIAKNIFYYAGTLADARVGLGFLLPLVAVAFWAAKSEEGPRRFVSAAVAIGALDLALYCVTWSTFDSARFLAIAYLTLIIGIVGLAWPFLERVGQAFEMGRFPHFARSIMLGVALLWGASDAFGSYLAWRENSLGRPYSNNLESVWTADGVNEIEAEFARMADEDEVGSETIIASNVPWLVHTLTGLPCALAPYDLAAEKWMEHLAGIGSTHVVIHRGDWPADYADQVRAYTEALGEAGWKKSSASAGELELWKKP